MIIKSVGVVSVAKIYAAVSGSMGLLVGILVAVGSMVGMSLAEGDEPAFIGMAMGVGAVVILPIFYACLGFVVGLIGAVVYNAVAGVVGGVRIDVE